MALPWCWSLHNRGPGCEHARVAPRSGAPDFAEQSAGDVVDESADRDLLRNPRMSAQLLQLVTDIFFDVLECVEKGGRNGGGSGVVLYSRAQILLAGVHQPAIGMVDDHEFLGAQQIVRDDQRTQR